MNMSTRTRSAPTPVAAPPAVPVLCGDILARAGGR